MRDLLPGAFVQTSDGGFELSKPRVDRGAEGFNLFRKGQKPGIDLVTDRIELMVKLGSRDEGVVASFARKQFSEQQGHRGDGGGWDEPVFELAGRGGGKL